MLNRGCKEQCIVDGIGVILGGAVGLGARGFDWSIGNRETVLVVNHGGDILIVILNVDVEARGLLGIFRSCQNEFFFFYFLQTSH